jgi:hypothetical protein
MQQWQRQHTLMCMLTLRGPMSVQSMHAPGPGGAREGGRKQIDLVMEKLRG